MTADLARLTADTSTRVGRDSGLGATVKFVLDGLGVIHLDATQKPNVVSNDDLAAACTLRMSAATYAGLLAGTASPAAAVLLGKIKVSGNPSIALKVQSLLED